MDVFHTLDDLKPYVFRVTDNGGETSDRYTVATCDGDYVTMSEDPYSPRGVFLSGEGYDPMRTHERVEATVERDIRWIDLPRDCQRSFFDRLNEAYGEYLSTIDVPTDRADAEDVSMKTGSERIGKGIFGKEGSYHILDEERRGPYATLREAFLATLPDAHDLSGPEYQTAIDIWEGGDPVESWNRYEDPPILAEDNPFASYVLIGQEKKPLAWFSSEWDSEAYAQNHLDDSDGLSIRPV